MSRASLLALGLVVLLAPIARASPIPLVLSHSGYLLDASDRPLSDLALGMTFRLYDQDAPVGSQILVWSASCTVAVRNGYYGALLGGASCGAGLDTSHLPIDAARYLEVSVGPAALLPRLRVTSAPSAAVAARSLDTEALKTALATPGTINAEANPVDWSVLKNVPANIAAGRGETYTAGGGLALTGTAFGIAPGGVTSDRLASDAASLVKVSGGALEVVAGGIVSTGSIAATGAGSRFVGDGSGLSNVPASAVTGLDSFAPAAHTHAPADVTGLSSALDGKAAVSHAHAIADVTGLQAALNGKLSTESDPKVGAMSNGKWCTASGGQVTCTSDAPTTTGAQATAGTAASVSCSGATVGAFWFDTGASVLKICNGVTYASVSTVAAPPAAPGAPTVSAANGSLAVSWTAVSGAASYEIGYQAGSVVDASATLVPVASGVSATISGLTNGTTYAVAVRSVVSGWFSAWSVAVQGTPQLQLFVPTQALATHLTSLGYTDRGIFKGNVLATANVGAGTEHVYVFFDASGNQVGASRLSGSYSVITERPHPLDAGYNSFTGLYYWNGSSWATKSWARSFCLSGDGTNGTTSTLWISCPGTNNPETTNWAVLFAGSANWGGWRLAFSDAAGLMAYVISANATGNDVSVRVFSKS